jgi:hypothetical protein
VALIGIIALGVLYRMPGRQNKERYSEYNGKYKYISEHFQSDFKLKNNKVEVKTEVEIEEGEKVEITDGIPLKDQLDDKQKKKRRELIKKAHPDRGGSDEELKKVLDSHGD